MRDTLWSIVEWHVIRTPASAACIGITHSFHALFTCELVIEMAVDPRPGTAEMALLVSGS